MVDKRDTTDQPGQEIQPVDAGVDAEAPPDEVRPGDAAAADAPGGEGDDLRRERDDLYDRLLRKTAEFENYRRRVDKERREMAERATDGLLEALLPVVDDFERALGADPAGDPEGYRKGVELIYRQMQDFLARRGVTPIDAVGNDFDPHYHQAITHEASPGRREGEVIEEVRRGYMHGDKLLRPALVKVAKA